VKTSTTYKSWRMTSNYSLGDIWDVHTATERWHVERVDGAAINPSDVSGILFDTTTGGPVIPGIGDPFDFPTPGSGTTWLESMLVRSHTWAQPSGKGIEVTVNYSTRYFETDAAKGLTSEVIGSATTLAKGLFLPCAVLPVFQSRNTRLFNDNPGMTGPNATLDISTADIGGTRKEIDADVRQVGVKLRMVLDSTSVPVSGAGSMIDIVGQYLGKKNSAAFLGYGVGNLVCSGATINNLESEFFELVMEYLYDEYFHHSQTVAKASDGRPDMNGTAFVDVRWTRPVRTAVDFNAIWPTGDLGKSMKYQAFAGRWY